MNNIARNLFTGRMDADSDPRFVAEGNFIYARNIVNTSNARPGAAVNIGGATKIPYTMPDGINQVIGTIENRQGNSTIIFMYNDRGNNKILEYEDRGEFIRELASGPNLPFSPFWPVHSGIVVDDAIVYWTDAHIDEGGGINGNSPKKVNKNKSQISGKYLEYEIYAGLPNQGQFNSTTFTFTVQDFDGNVLDTLVIGPLPDYADDPVAGLNWIAENLLLNFPTFVEVEICDCKLKVSMKDPGILLDLETNDTRVLLVASNHYAAPLDGIRPFVFAAKKEMPDCAPQVSYIAVPDVKYNNVDSGCFQFRYRYIFDDDEQSAWSPISLTALNNSVAGFSQPALNGIFVNFTDTRLNDRFWLSSIRFVEVAVRDANNNPFRLVKRIPVCEIGSGVNFFIFLNDKSYSVLPSDDLSLATEDTQVLGNTHHLPRLAASIAAVSDENGNTRLVHGGTLEGYECPDCVEGDVTDQTYQDDCLIDIIGSVIVINDAALPGPVYKTDFPSSAYKLDGFVVYLAGTSYYGVSKNSNLGLGDNGGEFTIKGVPKGRYVMRVASYQCRYGNDFGPRYNLLNGLEWQKTSSPVIDLAGSVVAHATPHERIIDLTAFGGTVFDLDTEVGYGDIEIQNAHATQDVGNTRVLIETYLVDSEGENGTAEQRSQGISVENLTAEFYRLEVSNTYSALLKSMQADHNGYAWGMFDRNSALKFRTIVPAWGDALINTNPSNHAYQGSWTNIVDDSAVDLWTLNVGTNSVNCTLVSATSPASAGPFEVYLFNGLPDWSLLNRGGVTGKVIDLNGSPVANVLVWMARNGRPEITNLFGEFKITSYAFNDTGFRGTVQPIYATFLADQCAVGPATPAFDNTNFEFDAAGTGIAGTQTISDFELGFEGGIADTNRYLKSGGIYKTGIVYEDGYGESCGAIPLESVRINFHTDDGQYARRQLQYSISSKPPIWARRYRIVRTKETSMLTYKHLPIGEAIYATIPSNATDPTIVSYASGVATHVLLRVDYELPDDTSADPLLIMFRRNVQNGYRAKFGDRVRYMLDSGLETVFSDRTLEVEVEGEYIDGEKYYVVIPYTEIFKEIEPGWVFEFFTPKTFEEEIYYETGVCMPILSPGTANAYHSGTVQNQNLGTGLPAVGEIVSGDTYWRYQQFNLDGVGAQGVFENEKTMDSATERCDDIGRAFLYDPNVTETYYFNRLRISGIYVPDSQVNNLSNFGALDFKSVNRQFGQIFWIGMSHTVLLCLCKNKAQPVYVGKSRVVDLSNQSLVGRTSDILTIADETVADAGTTNPESVVVEDGRVYWWDNTHGYMWRYGGSGVENISAGKINYFQDKRLNRKNMISAKDKVFGGYDRVNDLYFVTFRRNSNVDLADLEVQVDTLAFSEERGGFISHYDFIPEAYGRTTSAFLMFKDGETWLANTGTRCNVFDVQYDAAIRFAANAEPSMMKNWMNIRIQANAQWISSIIETLETSSYPNKMASMIPEKHWRVKEGLWWADFLRDMTDPSDRFVAIIDGSREVQSLLKGRSLKSDVLIVEITPLLSSVYNYTTFADIEYSIAQNTR